MKLRERLLELNGGDISILSTLKTVAEHSREDAMNTLSLTALTQQMHTLNEQKDRVRCACAHFGCFVLMPMVLIFSSKQSPDM